MTGLLVVAAILAVGGALVAVTGRDVRVALGGLVVSLAAAPFLANPLPGAPELVVRVAAVLFAGEALDIILRGTRMTTRGTLAGPPAEGLAAVAAFVIGFGTSGLGSAPLGPAEAQAAGFAMAVIAVGPIVRGSDVFRLGVALAILMTGAELIRVGLAGTPSPLEQLAAACLTIGLLGTVGVLCSRTLQATGHLRLDGEPAHHPRFEAHPAPVNDAEADE